MASLTANMNLEKFIQDVEDRPAIWNRSYHCNKAFMEETWRELSRIHRLPIAALKAKWKGLRDNFRVEFKRIPRDDSGELLLEPYEYQSKWLHYKSLLYLVDHMRSRAPKNEPNADDDNDVSQEHDAYYYEVNTHNQQFDENGYYLDNNLIQLPDDDGGEDDDIDDGNIGVNNNNNSNIHGRIHNIVNSNNNDIDDDEDDGLIDENSSTMPTISLDGITCNVGTLQVPPPPLAAATLVTPLLNGFEQHQRNLLNNGTESGGVGSRRRGTSTVISNGSRSNTSNKKRRLSNSNTLDFGNVVVGQDSSSDRNNIDDDYHFLMSLHPYMIDLNASQKLRVRMQIQKLVFKELFKDESVDVDIDE